MLGLPLTPETYPIVTDLHVVRAPRRRGAGTFNTVFEVGLRTKTGEVITGMFKPMSNKDYGAASERMGIPKSAPRTANRNLATQAYATALGFDVIIPTSIGVITLPLPNGQPRPIPSIGLIMPPAPGSPAAETSPEIFGRPDVIREVTKLQLLDHLTAQGDRHWFNYYIHINQDDQVVVRGIDNDQSFGELITNPDDIRESRSPGHKSFRGTRMPPVVDQEMASAICAMNPSQLTDMLADQLSGR